MGTGVRPRRQLGLLSVLLLAAGDADHASRKTNGMEKGNRFGWTVSLLDSRQPLDFEHEVFTSEGHIGRLEHLRVMHKSTDIAKCITCVTRCSDGQWQCVPRGVPCHHD